METPSPRAAWWHMPAMILSFIGLYLLWAIGFDWLAREMSGGVIEAALNWLSRVWFWGVLLVFAIALLVAAMNKRH